MKFIVNRKTVSLRGSKRPCDEAVEEELTPLDIRTVRTLEEAKKKIWYKTWIESCTNHREENGVVVADRKKKEKQWVVDLPSLDALIDFQERYGEIVIFDSGPFREVRKEIKILDGRKG